MSAYATDVSIKLEFMRKKLLLVEEVFQRLVPQGELRGDKADGLGHIITEVADEMREVYVALYGSPEIDETRLAPPSAQEPPRSPLELVWARPDPGER